MRQDVRFAIRSLARRPAFAISAILNLAIGIAATSAVFGIINGLLFKPIPALHERSGWSRSRGTSMAS